MQVVIDELHLLLRVSDVLIRNLILAAVAADNELRTKSSEHLTRLQERVKGCGITFRVQIIAMLINYYYLYEIIGTEQPIEADIENLKNKVNGLL